MGTTYSKPESVDEKAKGASMVIAQPPREVKREQIIDSICQASESRSSFFTCPRWFVDSFVVDLG